MSQRINSPRQPTLNFLDSFNKQDFPILSSSLVAKTKSPTPSQSPSPPKQNGVNSGKTSPSYEKPPRYKNFNSYNNKINRRCTRSGSNSPPPLEPKLEPIKETQLLKPKAEKDNQNKTRTRPKPVLSKEKLEAKTPTESSTPLVQSKFLFTSKGDVETEPTKTSTQIMNEYCKHYSLKTGITEQINCNFCGSYILRPYVKTNCCGKSYHSDCLSMLYTENFSFDFKNGNTMPYIYFNCECGFSNLDKEECNYNKLSKIYKYFELNIRNNIKV